MERLLLLEQTVLFRTSCSCKITASKIKTCNLLLLGQICSFTQVYVECHHASIQHPACDVSDLVGLTQNSGREGQLSHWSREISFLQGS